MQNGRALNVEIPAKFKRLSERTHTNGGREVRCNRRLEIAGTLTKVVLQEDSSLPRLLGWKLGEQDAEGLGEIFQECTLPMFSE